MGRASGPNGSGHGPRGGGRADSRDTVNGTVALLGFGFWVFFGRAGYSKCFMPI